MNLGKLYKLPRTIRSFFFLSLLLLFSRFEL